MRKGGQRLEMAGFTLIELVIVLVILGILAVTILAKFQDLTARAREASCQGIVGHLRSGIVIYFADRLANGFNKAESWPNLPSVSETGPNTGSLVLQNGDLPDNPYYRDAGILLANADAVRDATGDTKGAVSNASFGWAYDPTTGNFWANSSAVGENDF
jgi:prepilin-type N-terminal cleavage/methylation domain-containing protein